MRDVGVAERPPTGQRIEATVPTAADLTLASERQVPAAGEGEDVARVEVRRSVVVLEIAAVDGRRRRRARGHASRSEEAARVRFRAAERVVGAEVDPAPQPLLERRL